jgi:hypothetical protein
MKMTSPTLKASLDSGRAREGMVVGSQTPPQNIDAIGKMLACEWAFPPKTKVLHPRLARPNGAA